MKILKVKGDQIRLMDEIKTAKGWYGVGKIEVEETGIKLTVGAAAIVVTVKPDQEGLVRRKTAFKNYRY